MKRKIHDTFLCQKDHNRPSLVYLALNVFDRTQIDVNVHPTKNEVALLNQDTFIDIICHLLADKLTSSIHTSTDKLISFVQTRPTFNKQKALPKVKINKLDLLHSTILTQQQDEDIG
jgi:DNA mismatch repair ATPase MutL